MSSRNATGLPRFHWYVRALNELEQQLSAMLATIVVSPMGDEWVRIEAMEEPIAEAILRLRLVEFFDKPVVPIRRYYTLMNGEGVGRKWASGDDGRDMAALVQITIAAPPRNGRSRSRSFVTFAAWAHRQRIRRMSSVKVLRDRDSLASLQSRFHFPDELAQTDALDNPWLRKLLVASLTRWVALAQATKERWIAPSDIGPRRLATLCIDLYRDIEHYRMTLLQCGHELGKAGAFIPSAPTDRWGNPTGTAGDIWRRDAPVLHGWHQRLARHTDEMIGEADGIAADLVFGLGSQAGPTETKLLVVLRKLHDNFSIRAANHLGTDNTVACGFLHWHMDQAHEHFKPWWAVLAQELDEIRRTLDSVPIHTFASGGAVLSIQAKPTPPNGDLITPSLMWWDGTAHTLPPRLWRFLNFMRGRQSASFDEVFASVFDGDTESESTIRVTVSRVNTALAAISPDALKAYSLEIKAAYVLCTGNPMKV